MKKSQYNLLKLAHKFQNKYAEDQNLQTILTNAASYGEKSENGIMNFPAQLAAENANLDINVTINKGMMGGLSVEVGQPVLDPPASAPRYARLPEQIKKYLNKHISSFPQVYPGSYDLKFEYKKQDQQDPGGIAAVPRQY